MTSSCVGPVRLAEDEREFGGKQSSAAGPDRGRGYGRSRGTILDQAGWVRRSDFGRTILKLCWMMIG